MSGRAACAALVLAFCAACLSTARAANWLEKNFWLSGPNYSWNVPACDDGAALDEIQAHFAKKESRFWNSALRIVKIGDIRQTAFVWRAAQSIPRRFCSGVAVISDGRRRPVYYSIASGTGMIGMGWGVDFCVVGFDRDWAYGPDCRAAKP